MKRASAENSRREPRTRACYLVTESRSLRELACFRYHLKWSKDLAVLTESDLSLVEISYASTTIETRRELVLFDAAAILGAVGGSLGMFLGLSCLDAVRAVFWIAEKVK